MRRSVGSGSAGFSLLEALVAIVLLSTLGMAIYGLINTNVKALTNLRQAQESREAAQLAVEWMRELNPMQYPDGTVTIGDLTIRWQSRLLATPRRNMGYPRGQGFFTVAPYQVEIAMQRGDQQLGDLQLIVIGYLQSYLPEPA